MVLHTLPLPARRFARPAIGSVQLSFLVALYIAATLNRTFWMKAVTYLGFPSAALPLLIIGICALFVALCVTVSVKYATKPLFILFIVGAAAGAWFMDTFGTIIDADMIRNAAETTSSEAGHLITPGFVLHMSVFGLLPSLLVAIVRIEHRPFFSKFLHNLAVVMAALAVFTAVALANARTFAATIRQHHDLVEVLNPLAPIGGVIRYAMQSSEEAHVVVQPLGRDAHVVAPLASHRPRVTIIVAGETARAENFSLNGYGRDTNPELSKRDISYFNDTSSCGTATATSIPCMFSVFTRAQYSHEKGLANENLMDVLSHAGIKAEWWDNNTGSKAVADRIPYTSLSQIDDPRFCKDRECIDGVYLDRLAAWLDNVKGDSVLVLHQLGSHGPAYSQRYPEEFRRFTPDCRTPELDKCSHDEIVNAYDNTILYTDHILASVIDQLKSREDKMAGSMIYMSDHGESLGEHGLYLHGAPYFMAPSQQTHVPFVLWQSPEASANLDKGCIARQTTEPQSHDNLFHTVLGMMNVATSVYDPALDTMAACRAAS